MDVKPNIPGQPGYVEPTLPWHEARSQERYESLKEYLKQKSEQKTGENKMENTNNWEGLLLASLLNNNGWNNNNGCNGGYNGFNGNGFNGTGGYDQAIYDFASFAKLGDIQQEIATNAAQTENVVNTAANNTNAQIMAQSLSQQGNLAAVTLGIQQSLASVKEAVNLTGAAGQATTSAMGFQLAQLINSEGEKTRGLITNNEVANLNRIIIDKNTELVELQNENRGRTHYDGLRIDMINNQNQNQAQAQAQNVNSQILSTLGLLANELQRTSQNVVNLGTMVGSGQTANNTSVR